MGRARDYPFSYFVMVCLRKGWQIPSDLTNLHFLQELHISCKYRDLETVALLTTTCSTLLCLNVLSMLSIRVEVRQISTCLLLL